MFRDTCYSINGSPASMSNVSNDTLVSECGDDMLTLPVSYGRSIHKKQLI